MTRHLSGKEARKKCPEIQLVRVPEKRGKVDLTNYRKASAEVMQVLSLFSDCIERASIDEAYLDITERVKDKIQQMGFGRITSSMLPCTHVAGFSPDVAPCETAPSALLSVDHPQSLLSLWLDGDGSAEELCLAVGALLAGDMREAVLRETGFTCSAGIAHNKVRVKHLHSTILVYCCTFRFWQS